MGTLGLCEYRSAGMYGSGSAGLYSSGATDPMKVGREVGREQRSHWNSRLLRAGWLALKDSAKPFRDFHQRRWVGEGKLTCMVPAQQV